MWSVLKARAKQTAKPYPYPQRLPVLPQRFRGLPSLDASRCQEGCQACAEACPTDAIQVAPWQLDMGRCLFCGRCEEACPPHALTFTREFRLAARQREDLVVSPEKQFQLAQALDRELAALFGRSLRLRQVSAGGCNACEADANVLGTVTFDMARFGVQFVASPRHADGLLVTGPVTENMREALLATYEAVPQPKIVIASGACAISGGPFAGFPAVHNGVDKFLPVNLYVPGCPPHPWTLLDGILRLLGRLREQRENP
ncbi:MAG: hydrogenase [Thermoanaerobaculum sp.]|nr:MAG: hydrogenase [Thermoanaerobaculum sp.]GBC79444.1 Formate hydrogenlyase subunit 7 [bacterium HR09]